MIYTRADQINKPEIELLPRRLPPTNILLCTPEHFQVVDVKNPFMEGNEGSVIKKIMRNQWLHLAYTLKELSVVPQFILGKVGLEDMVFAANSGICWKRDGDTKPTFLISSMKHKRRRPESSHYEKWFNSKGYNIEYIASADKFFEGGGDALWHPGKMLLWGGYGWRTNPESYREIERRFKIPIIMLELVREEFYHLDTCFCPLNHNTVLYAPDAFSQEGIEIIEKVFPLQIIVNKEEARQFFSCNACVIQNRHIIIPKSDGRIAIRLSHKGFFVHEIDMSEFLKSGGGPACLWLEIY